MTTSTIVRRVVVGLVVFAGCSSGAVDHRPVDATRERLYAVNRAYGLFLAKGKAPMKISDLETHLKADGDPTELTVSPRDGQPFVILWGTRFTEPEPHIYIHEKEGTNGTRFVMMTDGTAYELPEERFQKLPKVR